LHAETLGIVLREPQIGSFRKTHEGVRQVER